MHTYCDIKTPTGVHQNSPQIHASAAPVYGLNFSTVVNFMAMACTNMTATFQQHCA
jgi:hypothetical protein